MKAELQLLVKQMYYFCCW